MRTESQRRGGPGIALVLFVAVAVSTAAADEKTPPAGSPMHRRPEGVLVTIPGAPLPAVDPDVVRWSIAGYEPLLAGLRLFGDSAALARGYGFLATLYAALDDVDKAEELFGKALAILEKIDDTDLERGWVYNNQGLARMQQDRYTEALQSARASVSILKAGNPKLLPHRARALQNLAIAHLFVGDAENSEAAFLEAVEVLKRHTDEDELTTSRTVQQNLAVLQMSIGDFAEARKILEALLGDKGLPRQVKVAALIDLGYVLVSLKDPECAEARMNEGLALASGNRNWRKAILVNLAMAYSLAGKFEQASKTGEEVLGLIEEEEGPDSRGGAAVLVTLGNTAFASGNLVKAERLLIRARAILTRYPGDTEALAGVTRLLAMVAQERGQRERALELSRQALDLDKQNLEKILAFGSEAQRLAYRAKETPYDQLANLGDGTLLAEAVLATKGAVIESLLVERSIARKSKAPADQARLDRIHALKVELMENTARGEGDVERLERALKQEETALAKSIDRPPIPKSPDAGLKRVQGKLEADQVLIEVVRFQNYEGQGKVAPWYGAVIIPHQGTPAWVRLGTAAEADELIQTLVSQLDRGNRGVERPGAAGQVTRPLRELHDRLWAPIERALPAGTHQVLLSPDGATHFVPWAALLDEQETFLAERWQLAQVGSGRDLLRPHEPAHAKTLLALVDGMDDLAFSRLEIDGVARTAKRHDWRTTILLGEQATEPTLLRHPRPGILHFATHGRQLDGKQLSVVEARLSRNPMYRGFLVLGGAKATLEAWQRDAVRSPSEDGILTAEEVAGLDLSETWLTVLSACRTGAGDARTGEGVLGLRRGFALAGTENLVYTLWSVDDAAAAQFIEKFYDQLFATGDPFRAFQETQKEELRRWRETNVATATRHAGAFVLTR